jgi:hypothetical protein
MFGIFKRKRKTYVRPMRTHLSLTMTTEMLKQVNDMTRHEARCYAMSASRINPRN